MTDISIFIIIITNPFFFATIIISFTNIQECTIFIILFPISIHFTQSNQIQSSFTVFHKSFKPCFVRFVIQFAISIVFNLFTFLYFHYTTDIAFRIIIIANSFFFATIIISFTNTQKLSFLIILFPISIHFIQHVNMNSFTHGIVSFKDHVAFLVIFLSFS